MTPKIEQLIALSDPARAAQMADYHKASRHYLGVSNPQIDDLVRDWREGLDIAGRVDLASQLWGSDIHEARIAAAKLLIQARIPDDGPVWI